MKQYKSAIMVLALVVIPTVAFAQASPSTVPSVAATAKETAKNRLVEVKLKVCQNREAAIVKRSTQLTKTAANMQEKFDAIAKRVQTYYTTKAVPAGKTVSTYDTLVTDIATKKAAVQTALDKATADAAAFSCAGDDPKAQLTLFRTDMQGVKMALKDYRTAVKDLIVAIRSVTGKTESSASPKSTPTPKTSATPAVSTTPEVE